MTKLKIDRTALNIAADTARAKVERLEAVQSLLKAADELSAKADATLDHNESIALSKRAMALYTRAEQIDITD